MGPKEASKIKKGKPMVPSERNHEVSHSTETGPQKEGLAGRVEGDALAQLQAMFAEETAHESAETVRTAESATHVGGAALADTASVEAVTPKQEREPRPPRSHTAQHADEHHDGIQPTQRFDKKEAAELWGVNDKIAPEDVPEGEMTWEQYIAQRPKAEEGDISHSTDKNGRKIYYEATTGHRVKGEDYLNQATYNRDQGQSHYDEVNEKREQSQAFDEAIVENEAHDEKVSNVLRANTEGEILVQKDERLKSLDILGKELLELRDSKVSKADYETELKPQLEAKAAAFKALVAAYETQGVDASGIHFIKDTYLEPYENIDRIQYKGSAHHEGEKVDVKDVVVSPAGDKAYVIEGENGEQKTVHAHSVDFKQEFDVPAEKKPGFFERLKKGLKKQIADIREFGAGAYLGRKWNDASDWLFNRHTEGLEGEELQKQKEKNRRNNLLGGAAILAGTAVAVWAGFQIHDALTPDAANISGGGAPSGSAGGETPGWMEHQLDGSSSGAAGGTGVENLPLIDGTEAVDITNPQAIDAEQAIQNSAYEIPSGGTGLGLFNQLGLNEATWYQHAQELATRFPSDFYTDGSDVRIMHSGWLSTEARTFIEGLRG